MKRLNQLTATEAAALLARKEISSEELVEACLQRIRERDPVVRAWASLDEEFALGQARLMDRTESRGPLHGIPFAVKDVIDTKDFPTERGSQIYQGRRPLFDATCVARMRSAGAVLLGKLVTTEFANLSPNETRNPHNLRHTPGGSSSGTAAAVADDMVPIGFGNQTAGSLIRPAAFCGVCGLKGTHGIADVGGILPLAPIFDTLGYMARSFEDIQTFLQAVVPGLQPAKPLDRKPKIAFCETYQWSFAQHETRELLRKVVAALREREYDVAELELPAEFSGLVETYWIVLSAGVANHLGPVYRRHKHRISERLGALIEDGFKVSDEALDAAIKHVMACRGKMSQIFGDYDVLLAPCTPGEAPVGFETGNPIFQVVWTLLGVPCTNLPLGSGPNELPLSVQLIGRPHDDLRLLKLAQRMLDDLPRIAIPAEYLQGSSD